MLLERLVTNDPIYVVRLQVFDPVILSLLIQIRLSQTHDQWNLGIPDLLESIHIDLPYFAF